jgi:hypothetical protein
VQLGEAHGAAAGSLCIDGARRRPPSGTREGATRLVEPTRIAQSGSSWARSGFQGPVPVQGSRQPGATWRPLRPTRWCKWWSAIVSSGWRCVLRGISWDALEAGGLPGYGCESL